MPQPKDKDWLNAYKNKTPIYAVYKRPTSKQGINKDINAYTSAIQFLIEYNRIRFNLKLIRINLTLWGFLYRIACG